MGAHLLDGRPYRGMYDGSSARNALRPDPCASRSPTRLASRDLRRADAPDERGDCLEHPETQRASASAPGRRASAVVRRDPRARRADRLRTHQVPRPLPLPTRAARSQARPVDADREARARRVTHLSTRRRYFPAKLVNSPGHQRVPVAHRRAWPAGTLPPAPRCATARPAADVIAVLEPH